jgi:hypothetical protein
MLHNEHLRKADELYEVRHDGDGNAIHVYIKDGEAVIFPSLNDLVKCIYFGDNHVDRLYILESELEALYNSESYSFYDLKDELGALMLMRVAEADSKDIMVAFPHGEQVHTIIFTPDEPEFWIDIEGFSLLYSEKYGKILVYETGKQEPIFEQSIPNK